VPLRATAWGWGRTHRAREMGLDAFTIICPTCQSRIRVRNASLIGQLANCPKCQSLVMIQRDSPAGSPDNRAADVDSRALTRENLQPTAGGSPDSAALTNEDGLTKEAFPPVLISGEAASSASSDGQQGSSLTTGRSSEMGAIEFSESDDPKTAYWRPPERAAPTEPWTSEKTNRSRQFLLVGFLGLTSIAATILMLVLFVRWYTHRDQPEGLSMAADSGQAVEPLEPEEAASQNDSGLTSDLPANGDEAGENRDEQDPAAAPADLDPVGSPDASTEVAADSETADPIDSAALAGEGSPSEVISDALAGNPLEPSIDRDMPTDEAVPSDPMENLPQQLRELAELIAQPFELTTPQALVLPDRPPVTAEELGLATRMADQSLPPVDVHVLANERLLRGLKFEDIPLAHAANYLSLIGGIPSVVDLDALSAANVDRNQRVSFALMEGTIGQTSQGFEQNTGLQVQSVDNRFWRVTSQAPDPQQLPWQIPLEGLVAGADEEKWLEEALHSLFAIADSGIRISERQLLGDETTLDETTWFEVARATENWRRQRGLGSQLPQYDEQNLQVPFVRANEVTALEQPLKGITSSQQSLAALLSTLCAQVGLNCWVDWPALAEIGLSPSTPILSVTNNRPLRKVLLELEFEHGLSTVIIDQQNLWITNQQAYRRSAEVFVLPADGKDAEYWNQYFRPLTPIGVDGISQIQLRITPDGDFLLVRCCRPSLEFN
jgi:hypothetical protein